MLCKLKNEFVLDNLFMFFIIYRLEKDYLGFVGLQIKYMMDLMYMKVGEMQMFF